jgi:2-(3-amino-3-carboxypropyl)histidine synthase
VRRLKERGVRRVALQFPEGLKRRAPRIAAELAAGGFEVVISGDPCYGACDLALDTLTFADVLVHFGHAPVDEHPEVIFEPVAMDFAVAALESALPLLGSGRVGIVTTVQHVHLIPAIEEYLRGKGIDAIAARGSSRTPHRGQILGCCYSAARACNADTILYIGTGMFHPVGVALATGARVIALDPYTGSVQETDTAPLLRQRFGLMERAKKGKTVGIILSTKSGQRRLDLARRRGALSSHAVLIEMREVSEGELLNLGFECYVNTACPRLAYDGRDRFSVPVLSPQEFEIVCGVRSWDEYAIDEIP